METKGQFRGGDTASRASSSTNQSHICRFLRIFIETDNGALAELTAPGSTRRPTSAPRRISEFNATTGALINANYILSISGASVIAFLGNDLFVSDTGGSGVLKEYDVSGAAASLMSSNLIGTDAVVGLAVIPEPGSAALLGLGITALLGAVGRRRA